jgi:hypothetical protein
MNKQDNPIIRDITLNTVINVSIVLFLKLVNVVIKSAEANYIIFFH